MPSAHDPELIGMMVDSWKALARELYPDPEERAFALIAEGLYILEGVLWSRHVETLDTLVAERDPEEDLGYNIFVYGEDLKQGGAR